MERILQSQASINLLWCELKGKEVSLLHDYSHAKAEPHLPSPNSMTLAR